MDHASQSSRRVAVLMQLHIQMSIDQLLHLRAASD